MLERQAGMKAVPLLLDVGHYYCRMLGLGLSLQGLLYIAERAFLSFSSESVRRGLLKKWPTRLV